jgi:Zn-dependent peptidase ImmA (M78 family)
MQLLHEISHALLNHQAMTDETRYRMERDAWDTARLLAANLGMRREELLIARRVIDVQQLGYEAI